MCRQRRPTRGNLRSTVSDSSSEKIIPKKRGAGEGTLTFASSVDERNNERFSNFRAAGCLHRPNKDTITRIRQLCTSPGGRELIPRASHPKTPSNSVSYSFKSVYLPRFIWLSTVIANDNAEQRHVRSSDVRRYHGCTIYDSTADSKCSVNRLQTEVCRFAG